MLYILRGRGNFKESLPLPRESAGKTPETGPGSGVSLQKGRPERRAADFSDPRAAFGEGFFLRLFAREGPFLKIAHPLLLICGPPREKLFAPGFSRAAPVPQLSS